MSETNGHADRGSEKWTRIYASLETKPDDLELWEDLIESVEQLEDGLNKGSSEHAFQLFRFSYDSFLERFPLLFGYWIKYSQLEFRLGFTERAEQVYEKAVSSVPCSVELWTSYADFKLLTDYREEIVRNLFERGAKACGLHFMAHPFWDKYIEFEEKESRQNRLLALLQRIIRIPLHQYARYFEQFRQLAKTKPADEQADPQDIEQFKAEYEYERSEHPEEYSTSTPTEDELQADLKARLANFHIRIYTSTQLEVTRRWPFESQIKRPYFHVKYLPESEMVAWRNYLHFEEVEGDLERVSLLYERCLTVTAHREEIWLRYTRWLISKQLYSSAREIFTRGCYLLPLGHVEFRLQYAIFEESQGEIAHARDIYQSILSELPNSLQIISRFAGFERRHTSAELAVQALKTSLANDSLNSTEKAWLISELAYIYTSGDLLTFDDARALYQNSVPDFETEFIFWREYLNFEIEATTTESGDSRVRAVYDLIKTHSKLDETYTKMLAHRYMEYLLAEGGSDSVTEYFKVQSNVKSNPF